MVIISCIRQHARRTNAKPFVSYEQENRGLNKKDAVIDTTTKVSHVPHQEMIIKDESTSYKLLSRKENADAVDDIVEQKRLLLQNKQEERKKLRENRHNERIDQHSFLDLNGKSLSSFNSSQDTKITENLSNSNYSEVQGKDANSIFEREDTNTSSGKGTEKNENEADERKDYNESNNENHGEEEEEKRRLRDAEEKEQLLLERIMFLERKRQKIYEKKQRELNSNNNCKEENAKQEDKKNNVHTEKKFKKHQLQNLTISKSPDAWSSHSNKHPKETNEDEKRRLQEALAAKRKNEAELERQREEIRQAAEERRLEEEAKQREEQEAAKERKRNFLENLQRLKQRVLTEEEEKSKTSTSQTKYEPSKAVYSTGRFSPILTSSTKSQSLPGFTKERDKSAEATASKTNVLPQTKTSNQEAKNDEIKPDEQRENEDDQRKADEMRRDNFKSNRELFMKKIQADAEQNVQVQRREKNKKIRPKSYYGGMFNKPVHQIIDDSLLAQNQGNSGDLVDEEALKQFQREQELKEEHEKVNKLRSNLERESSYTVENVEQLFCEADTENKKKTGSDWDNIQREEEVRLYNYSRLQLFKIIFLLQGKSKNQSKNISVLWNK